MVGNRLFSGVSDLFCRRNEKIILLLCGGSKVTQAKDIKNAINYWQDYLGR
jgi:putative addiction module killer protein